MNPYQAARARLRRAVSAAEVDEATRVLARFAVDPEYRGPRFERVLVPLGMPGLGAAMYLPVTETEEAAR